MPKIGLRDRVPGPVGGFKVLKDDAGIAILVRSVAPNVEVSPAAARRRSPRTLKPEMLVRRMVQHQLGNHLQATALGFAHEALKIFQRAIRTVHIRVIGYVISVILKRRWAEGQTPDGGNAQIF